MYQVISPFHNLGFVLDRLRTKYVENSIIMTLKCELVKSGSIEVINCPFGHYQENCFGKKGGREGKP